MNKEEYLEAWCNQRIEEHTGKKPINDMMIVDGCKQIKNMMGTKGWEGLKAYIKEQCMV